MGLQVKHTGSETPPEDVKAKHRNVEVKSSDATINKCITLRFPTGFTFSIRIEDRSMVVEAKLRENVVFFLDQIPASFIQDLKNLLRGF